MRADFRAVISLNIAPKSWDIVADIQRREISPTRSARQTEMAKFTAINSSFALRTYVVLLFGVSVIFKGISAVDILTDETVSLWLGKRNQSIPCYVRLDPGERDIAGFSWSAHNKSNVLAKVFRDVESGKGIESGEYGLSGNRSLVINRPITVEDEGEYFCRVVLYGDMTEHFKSSTIRVLSAPTEPYPTIPECSGANDEGETRRHADNSCILKETAGERLNLTCNVSGVRPTVDVVWSNGTRSVHDVYRTFKNESDGTQSLSVTLEVTARLGVQSFYCNVSGEAVGREHKWSIVTVEGVEADESNLNLIIIIVIVVIVAVVLVLIIVIVLILRSRRSREDREQTARHHQLQDIEEGPVPIAVEEPMPPMEESRSHEGTQTEPPQPEDDPLVEIQDEEPSDTSSEEQEQEKERLEEEERSQHSTSRVPSHASSRTDIAQHEFGKSWVVVSADELNRDEEPTETEPATDAEAGTSGQRPQREGPLSGVLSGVGSILDTFHNFFHHEA